MTVQPQTAPITNAANSVELAIGGMTCASCAARIEKKLNKLDGVSATVNYATEKAKVSYSGDVVPADLISTVEATGYTAQLPARKESNRSVTSPGSDVSGAGQDEAAGLRQRLLVSLTLTVPVVLLSMIPPLQFNNWQWLALALAAPVAVWGRCRFTVPRGRTHDTALRRWTR